MGEMIELKAEDGFAFGAYKATPKGAPKAGVLVIQEIFGVNSHMRRVTDEYAECGYLAIAPALFDRSKKDQQLGYEAGDMAAGRELRAAVGLDGPLLDLKATLQALKPVGKVGVVGYCWGGSLAFAAATRLPVDVCSSYYGGQAVDFAGETANCPVMFHFGNKDASIPMDMIDKIRDGQPRAVIHVYGGAGHGFNCEQRGSYDAAAQRIALGRTLEFFRQHIG